jgi:hypothetical protein
VHDAGTIGTVSNTGGGGKTASSASSGLMLNQPIVMDIGTSSIKAGFAGSSKPKVTSSHDRTDAKSWTIVVVFLFL